MDESPTNRDLSPCSPSLWWGTQYYSIPKSCNAQPVVSVMHCHKICSMHRHTGTPTWHWECLSDKTCDEPMCQDNAITCMKRWGTFLHEQERKSYLSHLKFNRLRTWLKQKITLSCKSLLIKSVITLAAAVWLMAQALLSARAVFLQGSLLESGLKQA